MFWNLFVCLCWTFVALVNAVSNLSTAPKVIVVGISILLIFLHAMDIGIYFGKKEK